MVSSESGLIVDFNPGEMNDDEVVDMKTTKNVKWVAKLGSQAYGNVTVAGGRVFVGTNNESPRDPGKKGDRGVVMCLDEKTGDLLWQLVIPKLGAGKVSDWEYIGVCSSPAVYGDRAYVVTNRCEVVCLDVKGLADGNAGPYKDEAAYVRPKGMQDKLNEKTDADIIWMYDMRDEGSVFFLTTSPVLQPSSSGTPFTWQPPTESIGPTRISPRLFPRAGSPSTKIPVS